MDANIVANVREKYLQRLGYRPLRFSSGMLSEHLLLDLPQHDPRLSPISHPLKQRDSPLVRLGQGMISPGSVTSSVFNLCCATLGAGALSLPFAIRNSGLILGPILLAIGCFLTVYSIRVLLHCRTKSRLSSYEDLAMFCFGPYGALFVEANIILFCFGTCVAYLVALADILSPVVLLVTHSWLSSRAFIIAITVLFIIFPISLVEKISSLSFASFLGLASITYLVLAVSFTSIVDTAKENSVTLEFSDLFNFSTDLFVAIPIIMFAFTCQVNVFSIYTELSRPCIRRMNAVVDRSSGITLLLYLLIGVFGYLQHLQDTNADILYNYSLNQPQIAIARLAVGLSLVFAFPMNVYPCRQTIELMLFPESPPSYIRSFIITAVVVFLSSVLAVFVPGIDAVFSLMGSVCSSIVCFVLPGAFYLIIEEGKWTERHKWGPLGLVVGGSIVGAVSAFYSLKNIIE